MTTAATPAKGRARTAPPTTAIAPAALSREDLLALLGQQGAIAQPTNDFHRMKLDGGILTTDDGEIFPPRKDGPALRVRIVSPPKYYNAIFLSEKQDDGSFDARRIGRGELNGRFTRKYDDPNDQAADTNPANAIFDEVAAASGLRGQFKADIEVQIVPESGEMTGDETVYTLALSTTSIFEWRGSARNPTGGTVSETNFMVELAEFAQESAAETGVDPAFAVLAALTSLKLGGVVADVYLLRATNPDNNQTWTVIHFTPVHIEPADGGAPALTAGDVPI